MTTILLLLAGDPATMQPGLGAYPQLPGTEMWSAVHAADDPMADSEYGRMWPYGGFVFLDFSSSRAAATIEDSVVAFVDDLGTSIERASSAVIAGTTHRIIDGRTSVALVYAIHRHQHLTVAEYQRHWLHRHGPLAKKLVATEGYEQTHADRPTSRRLAVRLGFNATEYDGNATCFFTDRDEFSEMLSARQAGTMEEIATDEARFIDHTRSIGAMMRAVPALDLPS